MGATEDNKIGIGLHNSKGARQKWEDADTRRLNANLCNFILMQIFKTWKEFKKNKTFLTCNEMNVAEEYCWAMTQAARRSYCSPSGSSVLKFGFHIHCLACTYRPIYRWRCVRIFRSDLRKSLLSQDLLNVITAFSQRVSLSFKQIFRRRPVNFGDGWNWFGLVWKGGLSYYWCWTFGFCWQWFG